MKNLFLISLIFLCSVALGQKKEEIKYETKKDISYVKSTETDDYKLARCKLDIYYPTNLTDFATVIFFHGGGLEGGQKDVPQILKGKRIAVVAPNYRLSPKVNHPEYIFDAAEAVSWTVNHIKEFGGDPSKIYISGHSAGGYLTLMLALDKQYLEKFGIDADQFAGYAPLSGQTNTHYTIRKERGLNMDIPIVDQYAPLNNARKMVPPMLLITGDRDLEMLARYVENLHLETILKKMGNENIKLYELNGFDHGTMMEPGCLLLLEMIKKDKNR